MEMVLKSVKPVAACSNFVNINNEAILEFANTVKEEDFGKSEWQEDTIIPALPEEQQIALPIVYSAVNFSYWGDPKWTVLVGDKFYDGSAAMLRVLKSFIEKGYQILDPYFLAELPEATLQRILLGNVEIPLFNERLENLRTLGKVTTEKFGGSFKRVVEEGGGRATGVVEVLIDNYPSVFRDEANYHGLKVGFYKRAQLVPGYINDLAGQGFISRGIEGLEEITAFADYKVPQLLRHFGILEYTDSLARKVDAKIELPSGSDKEIEIRANTVWAIELATKILRGSFPEVRASQVDGLFWFKGQEMELDKPYHRTRTTWY